MDSSTVSKAIDTLDGMQEIVEKEMLIKGSYASPIVRDDLAESGAICGGRRYCAIGSLLTGYGIISHVSRDKRGGVDEDGNAIESDSRGFVWSEEFEKLVQPYGRAEHYAEYPALQLAHDALNREAFDWMMSQPDVLWEGIGEPHELPYLAAQDPAFGGMLILNSDSASPIEALFESSPYFADTEEGRGHLAYMVARAKQRIMDGDFPQAGWRIPVPQPAA